MKPLPPAEQTCENCVHERDKGPEHCPCCGGDPPSAFQEDPWHLEQRADAIIGELRGQLAATREMLKYMRDHAPLREQSRNGPYSQEDRHWRCMCCEGRTVDYLSRHPEHEESCPYTVVMQALSSDFGKPEADVIAAAPEALHEAKYIIQRLYENMWGGRLGDWKTYAPKLAVALEAVERMHEGRS